MHKTKKKSKTAKLPKPIKVKKEKSDGDRLPQPMTHYLDDRLEMVKQIFNSLKPKTIVNLAPDFLKTQPLEDIEEACLNELMCISTKRLKSIITSTKCPTDTESSEDSDVERHEEHISLEEISSDSEIEGSSKKAKKKKPFRVGEGTEAAKKTPQNQDNQVDGQISVLELLELQARARAIRSQLALEPVTKIEVDSDEEKSKAKDKSKSSKREEKANKNDRKRDSSERESRNAIKQTRTNGSTDSRNSKAYTEKEFDQNTSKRIKLKRNCRSLHNKDIKDENPQKPHNDTNKEDKENTYKVKLKAEKIKEQERNRAKYTLQSSIKKEKSSRSPSPDVIPIIAEPETLCITDSSDEEKKAKNKTETVTASSDEAKIEEEKNAELNKDKENSTDKHIETEEPPELPPSDKPQDNPHIGNSSENTQNAALDDNNSKYGQESNSRNKDPVKLTSKDKSKLNDGTNFNNHSDDDQNDDVISLGGDLENEMNEQLENEVVVMDLPYHKKTAEDSSQDNNKSQEESQAEDVISLESSEDERGNQSESWHSRYIKSSKVSKVLATSRLGKRVRDKIKKSKHSKKEISNENLDGQKDKLAAPTFTSKHEDGSVEQYKELLEMRQRKSS